MLRSYIFWGLSIAIGIYIIKTIVEMFTQKDTVAPAEEEEIPSDLLEAYESYPSESETTLPSTEHDNTITAPDPAAHFVKVFVTPTGAQAEILILKLQESGIESYIEETGTSILPFGDNEMDSKTILVKDKDEPQAKKIIKNFLKESN
ncbi:MAG: DUF2007 domain-containing protein [bacterium]|nr:DUF2007 domain-containing protein [bacterium]